MGSYNICRDAVGVFDSTSQLKFHLGEICSLIKQKRFLPSYSHFSTTIWVHLFDSNETLGEKKLDGNYTKMLSAALKKIPEAAPLTKSSCTATYLPSRKPRMEWKLCRVFVRDEHHFSFVKFSIYLRQKWNTY